MPTASSEEGYVAVADVAIDAVRPGRTGFVLQGRGKDRADYRIELHLEMPVDQRTRTVLGELLAQSEWRVSRRVSNPLDARAVQGRPKSVG